MAHEANPTSPLSEDQSLSDEMSPEPELMLVEAIESLNGTPVHLKRQRTQPVVSSTAETTQKSHLGMKHKRTLSLESTKPALPLDFSEINKMVRVCACLRTTQMCEHVCKQVCMLVFLILPSVWL